MLTPDEFPDTRGNLLDSLETDPTAYILSANVHRRHLTKSQQAMAMALSKPESKMGRGSDSAKVASQLGLSGELPRQARYVLRNNFTPEAKRTAAFLGIQPKAKPAKRKAA